MVPLCVAAATVPLALRKAYGSSWSGAIFKSVAVYFSYAMIFALGFAAVAVLVLFLI